jgi:hypothetical protein
MQWHLLEGWCRFFGRISLPKTDTFQLSAQKQTFRLYFRDCVRKTLDARASHYGLKACKPLTLCRLNELSNGTTER